MAGRRGRTIRHRRDHLSGGAGWHGLHAGQRGARVELLSRGPHSAWEALRQRGRPAGHSCREGVRGVVLGRKRVELCSQRAMDLGMAGRLGRNVGQPRMLARELGRELGLRLVHGQRLELGLTLRWVLLLGEARSGRPCWKRGLLAERLDAALGVGEQGGRAKEAALRREPRWLAGEPWGHVPAHGPGRGVAGNGCLDAVNGCGGRADPKGVRRAVAPS